uniref:LisH domain-containing protein n=1 Tax=Rhabditophanes sp. KR3021 TaxID=114890 RepID=A0AC35TWN1_9BILA
MGNSCVPEVATTIITHFNLADTYVDEKELYELCLHDNIDTRKQSYSKVTNGSLNETTISSLNSEDLNDMLKERKMLGAFSNLSTNVGNDHLSNRSSYLPFQYTGDENARMDSNFNEPVKTTIPPDEEDWFRTDLFDEPSFSTNDSNSKSSTKTLQKSESEMWANLDW